MGRAGRDSASRFSASSECAPASPQTILYSQFLSDVKSGSVESVTLKGEVIEGKRRDGNQFVVYNPETNNSALIGLLAQQNVKFGGEPPNSNRCSCSC